MPSSELPDDINQWPSDPFSLLGVQRGDDELTIRRAYTKLIRRFKPESHPDQFALIRKAYEACTTQHTWFRIDTEQMRITPSTSVSKAPEPRDNSTPNVTPKPTTYDQLWVTAIEGKLNDAYRGLVNLLTTTGDKTDLYLRLYWLLSLDSTLDTNHNRHDWLFAALKESHLQISIINLYQRESQIDPQAVLAAPYTSLQEITAPVQQHILIVRIRAMAAIQFSRYVLIEGDLCDIKKKLSVEDDAIWLYLIASMFEWSAYDQPNQVFDYCFEELKRFQNIELQFSHIFDRLDQILYSGVSDVARYRNQLPQLIRLIVSTVINQGTPDRRQVIAGVSALAANPHHALIELDNLLRNSASIIYSIIISCLVEHCSPSPIDIPADILRGYYRHQLEATSSKSRHLDDVDLMYSGSRRREFRKELLAALIRDEIDPLELAKACIADTDIAIREEADLLSKDLSMRIVWLATMLCKSS